MQKIIEMDSLSCTDLGELTRLLKVVVRNGWQLFGNVFYEYEENTNEDQQVRGYAQLLVKYELTPTEAEIKALSDMVHNLASVLNSMLINHPNGDKARGDLKALVDRARKLVGDPS